MDRISWLINHTFFSIERYTIVLALNERVLITQIRWYIQMNYLMLRSSIKIRYNNRSLNPKL